MHSNICSKFFSDLSIPSELNEWPQFVTVGSPFSYHTSETRTDADSLEKRNRK